MELRPYQSSLAHEVRAHWEYGARNVLMRLDTGGGKTVILSELIRQHVGAAAIIAHRQELVIQLSMALATLGIRHNLVAAKKTIRTIVQRQIRKYGRSFYDPGNRIAVASIDTLIKAKGLEAWFAQVTFWIVDEGHHVVEDNKWHTVLERFTNPHVHGLLPTATPERADGVGLGRGHGGVADVMIQGPPMRWLIDEGYLTDYRMVCVKSDLVDLLENAKLSAGGDISDAVHREATARSHIVGDVAKHYLAFGAGKRAIVFMSDVDAAGKMARKLREVGVKAEALIGDMDDGLRVQYVEQLESGALDALVAVDVVSEGFDLPAIEVGIFARKTESLATYMQQFGRVLRPVWAIGSGYGPEHLYNLNTREGRLASIAAGPKPVAIIIDHVTNFLRHGPPDRLRPWTLEGRRRSKLDGIPLTACGNAEGWAAVTAEERARVAHVPYWLQTARPDGSIWIEPCAQPYERFHPWCPHCGFIPVREATGRSSPGEVDGDLVELSPEILAQLRGSVTEALRSVGDYARDMAAKHAQPMHIQAHAGRHGERLAALEALRLSMEQWGGAQRARGLTDRQMQRLFFLTFGVDVLSAQALDRPAAEALRLRVDGSVITQAYEAA